MTRSTEPIDRTKLRYVMYARKSSEDESSQLRSTDDQIKDCWKIAKQLGLHVIGEPLEEKKSAKKPNERPIFNQMLKDIRAKKYDAILCWHPDRLCRNMLEGGEIIDMLDEGVLKDICFHSHQFSNDANGKMLLGMLFVFSKQYSDDLSDKVNRGVEGNWDEGKSGGQPKWGYDRSEVTGLYEPNEFFGVVKEAWLRRANGESLAKVVEFLNLKGYHRMTKPRKEGYPRPIKPSVSSASGVFRDPFYYGVLEQANQTVDLREIYPNFEPMIDQETYNQVQAIGYGRTKDTSKKKRAAFYPLHGFVYCDICNSSKHMYVGKNKSGGGKHVLTYRCDNPVCTRKPKSFRAKEVFKSIYTMLDKFELKDEAYERYSKRIDSMTDDKIINIKRDIQSRRGALAHIKKELNDRALSIVSIDKTSAIYKSNEQRIDELAGQQADIESKIAKLEAKVADPRQIKVSKEEFLNLVKTASDKMKAGSSVEKDILCRILFLNLHVDNEKVVSYHWKEPFATLVALNELSYGGRGGT